MENQELIILDKLRQIIVASCKFDDCPKMDFQDFHADFLKFCFSALSVKIDYKTKSIFLLNSKPLGGTPLQLFDINNAISEKVTYTDLEETLLGCIEVGEFQNRFYKHLIFEYGHLNGSQHNNESRSA